MEAKKTFPQMSKAEREAWLADYQKWYADSLPAIEKATVMVQAIREAFEKGLHLLSVFPFCRSFVTEALRFRDYGSRKKLLRRYADKATADAQNMMGTAAKVDLTNPELLKSHVGRPTTEEAQARAIKMENDRKEAEAKEETLFGPKADIPTIDPAAPATVSGSLGGGALLHLDQLKWLLSPELAEAVETIRDLRNKAADASTTAKTLAMAGKSEDEVKPYSQDAIRYTEEYEAIYERVDKELAKVYVRLKEDTAYIDTMTTQKVDPSALRTILRPYWDKVEDKDGFKAKVIEEIKAADPEQAAIREAEEKKKKEVADIIKYLTRKDKPNTPTRIKTMTERYQELVALVGEEEAKTYLPVLEAAKKDCEENVVPAKEKEKTEREAAKKAKKTSAKKTK